MEPLYLALIWPEKLTMPNSWTEINRRIIEVREVMCNFIFPKEMAMWRSYGFSVNFVKIYRFDREVSDIDVFANHYAAFVNGK